MKLLKENYITEQYPEDYIDKSYEKIIYKNIELLDDGKYKSNQYLMNALEYNKYIQTKEYKENILFNGEANFVGEYQLINSVNNFSKIRIVFNANNSKTSIEIGENFNQVNSIFSIYNNSEYVVNFKFINNKLNIVEISENSYIEKIIGIK